MRKRAISAILACVCACACAACGDKTPARPSADDYTYTRESTTDMLKFSSSDGGLDDFLNDYFHRHVRYDDKRIDSRDLGTAVTFGKEWESQSLMFFDSTETTMGSNRQSMLRNYINGVPVDRFGYVWNAYHSVQENDTEGNVYFHQGWPFPAYATVRNTRARGWEFAQKQDGGWTTTLNGEAYPATVESNTSGDGKLSITSNAFTAAEFISPDTANIDCSFAPFLEFDIRITDTSSADRYESFVDDLEVWWRHDGETWDESRKVTYGDFCTTGDMTISPTFNRHIYFPMYLHPAWGTSGASKDRIKQFKLVVKTKADGKTHKGSIKLNFVRAQFDTRQTNNIGIFLSTAQKYLEFSGDTTTLKNNLSRFRAAMQFLIGYCNGADGLVDRSGFVGHLGSKGDVGSSIGNGYWDMLSTPTVSLYANLFYYRAVQSMLYIERMAAEEGIEQALPAVWNTRANGTTTYPEQMTISGLENLLSKIRAAIQAPVDAAAKTGFWDETKGRFIEGFDLDGDVVDYGYVMYNLEAIATGVATDAQAARILSWVNGDRIVSEDIGEDEQTYATGKRGTAVQSDGYIESSGTLGIYDYEFAPRTSTVKNYDHYYWDWDGSAPYAAQLQDGGATMYVSYYDILSRISTRGADDAFSRLKEIQSWYEKVKAAADAAAASDPDGGYDGVNFYRPYYDNKITLQGNGVAGTLGLDCEFLESSMLYAAVPYGFFGLSASERGALTVSPSLPSKLDWWKLENLYYRGVHYDLTVFADGAQIDYVRGDTDGLSLTVRLDGNEHSVIYLNGAAQETTYDATSGKVSATVPLRACRLTVK